MSRPTLDPTCCLPLPRTRLSRSTAGFSKTVLLASSSLSVVLTPERTRSGLGSSHFARRYFGNRCFFLFLRLLRCFSSPGSPCISTALRFFLCSDGGLLRRVSPFGHLRINGYLRLPAAFRSLLRLSSALSTKASTLRSCSLTGFAFPPTEFCGNGFQACSVMPAGRFGVFFQHLFFVIYTSLDISSDVFSFLIFRMWFSRCFDSQPNQKIHKPSLYSNLRGSNGDEEIRTLDPLLARQVLSQLSYIPIWT